MENRDDTRVLALALMDSEVAQPWRAKTSVQGGVNLVVEQLELVATKNPSPSRRLMEVRLVRLEYRYKNPKTSIAAGCTAESSMKDDGAMSSQHDSITKKGPAAGGDKLIQQDCHLAWRRAVQVPVGIHSDIGGSVNLNTANCR